MHFLNKQKPITLRLRVRGLVPTATTATKQSVRCCFAEVASTIDMYDNSCIKD